MVKNSSQTIGPGDSELFSGVDNVDDDGRLTASDHNSSSLAFGSGELKHTEKKKHLTENLIKNLKYASRMSALATFISRL